MALGYRKMRDLKPGDKVYRDGHFMASIVQEVTTRPDDLMTAVRFTMGNIDEFHPDGYVLVEE